MKRVVKSTERVTELDKVNTAKSYGILHPQGYRAFVTRQSCVNSQGECPPFEARDVRDVTNALSWGELQDNSLKGLLNKALSRDWQVFEFDSGEELMLWVSQKR